MTYSNWTEVENRLAEHYAPGGLLDLIGNGLAELGKSPATVELEDLAPVEEFHVGSRDASRHLLDPLEFNGENHVLDIGCGIGGPARHAASEYGCKVTGIDLTEEFIATGRTLNQWLGLEDRINLLQGSAFSIPAEDEYFDGAYMLHVGMNIEDKPGLCREVARVLKPGAPLAIYDLMRVGEGEIRFPVPWSQDSASSFVGTREDYKAALESAGFTIKSSCNRHDFALRFYDQMKSQIEENGGPGPIGLHLLMGETTKLKLDNAYEAILAGRIAPIEIHACR